MPAALLLPGVCIASEHTAWSIGSPFTTGRGPSCRGRCGAAALLLRRRHHSKSLWRPCPCSPSRAAFFCLPPHQPHCLCTLRVGRCPALPTTPPAGKQRRPMGMACPSGTQRGFQGCLEAGARPLRCAPPAAARRALASMLRHAANPNRTTSACAAMPPAAGAAPAGAPPATTIHALPDALLGRILVAADMDSEERCAQQGQCRVLSWHACVCCLIRLCAFPAGWR